MPTTAQTALDLSDMGPDRDAERFTWVGVTNLFHSNRHQRQPNSLKSWDATYVLQRVRGTRPAGNRVLRVLPMASGISPRYISIIDMQKRAAFDFYFHHLH